MVLSAAPPSLSINPSNQGLKHYIHLRITERYACLYPSIHQIKGWNRIFWKILLPAKVSLSINPSNQGLKHELSEQQEYSGHYVSIHQSIKSRVETMCHMVHLKTPHPVSIHQSIKSRVETVSSRSMPRPRNCLYPSIHQIKGWNYYITLSLSYIRLCLYPSIHQIKGWNQFAMSCGSKSESVSIHQSIKSRVETMLAQSPCRFPLRSLSINPSNQGLKLSPIGSLLFRCRSLYPSIHQIKGWNNVFSDNFSSSYFRLYPSIHQIKGWNLRESMTANNGLRSLSINPSNQGLKPAAWRYGDSVTYCLYPSIHQIKGWNCHESQQDSDFWCLYPSIHQIKGWNLLGLPLRCIQQNCLYPSIHQIKGWNSDAVDIFIDIIKSLSINPSNQGLKPVRYVLRVKVWI